MSNLRRISNELRFFREEPTEGCTSAPMNDDLYQWLCTVSGPVGSAYEGKQFQFIVMFPANYPFEPPEFQLQNNIFHPNLAKGKIVINSLAQWTPVFTISKVLEDIYALLKQPSTTKEVVINLEAKQMFENDKESFQQQVKKTE